MIKVELIVKALLYVAVLEQSTSLGIKDRREIELVGPRRSSMDRKPQWTES